MADTKLYRSTLRKQSVSESDTDPLNSTANLRGNPSQFFPSDQAELNPMSLYPVLLMRLLKGALGQIFKQNGKGLKQGWQGLLHDLMN